MSKSIIPKDKKGVCYMCKRYTNTEVHHIIGGGLRKKSDKDGLTVNLCHWCHNEAPNGVHQNRANDLHLKRIAERTWCDYYEKTIDDFIKAYGKNYIDNVDLCVSCGAVIPEGRMICYRCERWVKVCR